MRKPFLCTVRQIKQIKHNSIVADIYIKLNQVTYLIYYIIRIN